MRNIGNSRNRSGRARLDIPSQRTFAHGAPRSIHENGGSHAKARIRRPPASLFRAFAFRSRLLALGHGLIPPLLHGVSRFRMTHRTRPTAQGRKARFDGLRSETRRQERICLAQWRKMLHVRKKSVSRGFGDLRRKNH